MFQPHPCQNINDIIMVFRASIQNLAWIALAPVKYRHYLDGPRKLRSLASKWVSYNLLLNAVYWAYNPLILTFDPNFHRTSWYPGNPSLATLVGFHSRDKNLTGVEVIDPRAVIYMKYPRENGGQLGDESYHPSI